MREAAHQAASLIWRGADQKSEYRSCSVCRLSLIHIWPSRSRLKEETTMAYFYWVMGLAFAILLASVVEVVLSKNEH